MFSLHICKKRFLKLYPRDQDNTPEQQATSNKEEF